ncbi:MAG: sugar phosphate isomerase/epimerase family protein [Solirubrobacterales bacterium]
MDNRANPLRGRLGLGVPTAWWAAPALLKSFEAAGFTLTQIPSPPPSVLRDTRQLSRYASGLRAALGTTALEPIVHAPSELCAGVPPEDRAFEGLLAYAAEIGASHVVYHAHALPDHASSEDRLLAETSSLARLATRAERLRVTIAIENLAPLYPRPERLSDTPLVLRALAHRIGSPRLGLCLDLGHAHIVAGLKHTSLAHMVGPALDSAVLFHVHDNLGARWDRATAADVDPLRLDLHLPPGRGTLPWAEVAPLLREHRAPILLEVHPPKGPQPDELFASTRALLDPESAESVPAAA